MEGLCQCFSQRANRTIELEHEITLLRTEMAAALTKPCLRQDCAKTIRNLRATVRSLRNQLKKKDEQITSQQVSETKETQTDPEVKETTQNVSSPVRSAAWANEIEQDMKNEQSQDKVTVANNQIAADGFSFGATVVRVRTHESMVQITTQPPLLQEDVVVHHETQ